MLKTHHVLASLALSLGLVGCASPDKLCRIRSLSTVTKPEVPSDWGGAFPGLRDLLAKSPSGHVNLLYVHGIGWSQKQGDPPFGKDLAELLAKQLGAELKWPVAADLCPLSQMTATDASSAAGTGGLTLKAREEKRFFTDDPQLPVDLTDLGCLDRIELSLPGGAKTVTLYRYFWDDALWNTLEWPHVGYDDPVGLNKDGHKVSNVGYDDVDALRAPRNREIKNNVITWGLTDAAAYLGPAGAVAREGLGAAICAAAKGDPNLIDGASMVGGKWHIRTSDEVCGSATGTGPSAPLAILSHSLGSRVVFDVLTRELDRDRPGVSQALRALPNDALTVYLMANQIPLLGTGRLWKDKVDGPVSERLGKPLTFVAFSEINDLMTYEVVPYFEHMSYLRNRPPVQPTDGVPTHRDGTSAGVRQPLESPEQLRRQWVTALGFDVVDVRLSFATELLPLGLAYPDEAHSGYFKQSKHVADLLLNGVADAAKRPGRRDDCTR